MKAKHRTTVASVAVFAMTAGAQAGDMTHYSRQGWWNIRVKMLSDGSGVCHAAANYSGTYIAMMSGYVDGERRWSIMIGNPAWKWVKQDVEYAMTLDTPGRPYGVKFKGDVSNGDRFLFSFVDKDVINALAMDHPGRSFVVRQGPKVFGLYRLDDSAAAIRDVVNCVKAHQPSKTASVPSASSAPKSFGTGFFVANNYVLTNYHVVKSCSKVLVKYPSFMAEPAYDVGSDEVNDLILLKTKLPNRGVAAFRFQPKLGEPVASYGFPLGQLLAPEGNFTLGNITGTTGVGGDTRHFQMSAPVQPGNSGGPVLDMSGRVMGLAVSSLDAMKIVAATGQVPQNVNFAISAPIAVNFLMVKDVPPKHAGAGEKLEPEKLADAAKTFTVQVACN